VIGPIPVTPEVLAAAQMYARLHPEEVKWLGSPHAWNPGDRLDGRIVLDHRPVLQMGTAQMSAVRSGIVSPNQVRMYKVATIEDLWS
jgi:hypothetical protein